MSGPGKLLWRKLGRDLQRQRRQFIAVGITVFLGVGLFTASFDAFQNLEASYSRTYERLAFADFTANGANQDGIVGAVQGDPDVEAIATRTRADVAFQVGSDKLVGRIVGMPADRQPSVNQLDVKHGGYLQPGDPEGVLVEVHMADHFGLRPGDAFTVMLEDGPRDVHVVGVVASPEYLWPARSRQDLITTPESFGVVFAAAGLVEQAPARAKTDEALVRLASGVRDRASAVQRIEAALVEAGASDVITREEQPSNAALHLDLQGFNQLSWLFPLLFLAAGGLATVVLLNRLVWSQRSIIGTLRAQGVGQWSITLHVLSYGLVVGGAGALLGVLAGIPFGSVVTGAYTSELSIPDTVTQFHPLTPVYGMTFGLAVGGIAALMPAQAALRIAPGEALRGAAPAIGGGPGFLERLVPPLARLPIRWKIPLRGIWRGKQRSLSTIVGVVLSLVLILAAWGMIDTVEVLLARQFDSIQRGDAEVSLTGPVTSAAVEQIRDVDEVAVAERVLTVPVALQHGMSHYGSQLQAFQNGTQMHTFYTGSGRSELPQSGILVGQSARNILDVSEGDRVTLVFPTLGVTLNEPVRGFVDEPLGTFVYADRATIEEKLLNAATDLEPTALRAPGAASVMVRYADGADRATVERRIEQMPGVAAVVSSRAVADLMGDYLGFFYAFVGVMLVFGAIMAFALIFNTVSVNLAERSAEFATMRANGVSASEIASMMSRENLLLTIIGIPIGIAAGYWVASLLMATYSSDLFSFDLHMRLRTPVLAAAALLAVTLLSQWPARRSVRRLDIARVARERSQ